VAPEQQPKPEQKSLNNGDFKCTKETYLLIPYCSHFDNTRVARMMPEFNFFIGVALRAEE
jgi:hypothetical protein